MEIIISPSRDQWSELTRRNIPDDPAVTASVGEIIERVRREGDAALVDMAARFDHCDITASGLEVSADEMAQAEAAVSDTVKEAIRVSAANIEKFHRAQLPKEVSVETMPGVHCVQKAVALQRIGLYIPGGQAPLFSTVLMLGIPAKIAGCPSVTLFTPQSQNRPIAAATLYAAKVCGIHKIYRVGGAQAIAAMALGTESIAKVDKIFGPGNRFVTKAKQMLSSKVAIDMPAGPSEVLVMADESCNPIYVASDMLSQAEHGPDSQAICVCSSAEIAKQVATEVDRLKQQLSRTSSIEQSLSHSRIIVLGDVDSMIDFVNTYAPEHLIISMTEPDRVAERIVAAGSVFIGNYSPESAGDYASGTNHTLPTNGWAHSYSGVNIDSFVRKITFQRLSQAGLQSLAPTIITMAQAEGLDAHALAVRVRTE